MRGPRIAAAALAAVVAVTFLAVRGCGDDGGTPPRPEPDDGEARDDGSANRDGESRRSPRARAVRPPVGAEDPDRLPQDDTTCRLRVRVLADPERTPLAGARVVVLHQPGEPSAITDMEGYAVLDVRRGVRTGRVESPGRTTTGFAVDCNAERAADVVHLPVGARLEGRVSDAATAKPLSGVRIALFSGGVVDGWTGGFPAAEPFAELTSDDDGRFGIDGLAPAGAVTIESSLPGRARNRKSFLLDGPGVLRADIAMEPGGSVAGFVRGADGTAVPDAVVTVAAATSSVTWIPGCVPFHGRTSADGAYRVEGLDLDGVYVVECSPSAFSSVAATDVRPTAARPEVRCDLTFAPTGVLRIELAGKRVGDETVRVLSVTSGAIDTELGRFADGQRIELTPQRLRVEWDPEDGHPPIHREVRIESGAETLVRIERPPVHRAVVRFVDADGRPADAEFTLTRFVGDQKELADATRLEDGTYEIEDIAAGPWNLDVDFWERPTVRLRIVVPCEPLVVAAPAPTSLRFRLPDGIDGVFVRWAVEATVEEADGSLRWESWTSGTGPAGGEPLVEGGADWTGPTRLRAAVAGFLPFERILDVEPGSHHDVVAGPLVPCPTLRGRVVDGRGRPVADAEVAIGEEEPFDELRARVDTDEDGRFTDLSLPPGPTTVLVEAKGLADRRIELPGPPAGPLEIVLSRPGRLFVRARDRSDAPAVGRDVRVVDAAGRTLDLRLPTTTDHRGRCELLVPPGRLRVTVGDGESVGVEVTEQGTATIDVVVP